MLFNSIEFAIYLPVVFALYWLLSDKSLKLQNSFLIVASYFFYGWWDWRFLGLIAFSSLVDYTVGIGFSKVDDKTKRLFLLLTSLFVNIGLLGVFKYYNFFVENFANAFIFLGQPISGSTLLNVILPVGISFYTFQTLSYSIDIYKRRFEPTRDIVAFFAFVSFFPQLVAGPIERAANLLPQFYKKKKFEYDSAVDGMRQILWGLFKKVVIADNCAIYADEIFLNYHTYPGSTLLLGVFFFAFQIYGDFSGYSDIAIGVSRLFGIDLTRNFSFPYFSRDIAEFWRRWHISLSTWFRDYVYIPLGGSRVGTYMKIRNIFTIFVVSGFWHGANWTFIVWGALNAIYFLPLILSDKNRDHTNTVAEGRWLPNLKEIFQMGITFFITLIAWVFFRAESIDKAIMYIEGIFSKSLFSIPEADFIQIILILIVFILVEWIQREKQHVLQFGGHVFLSRAIRWSVYVSVIFSIYFLGNFNTHTFIYFQF